MARKYEIITELYRRTIRKITAPQEWQRFLTTACRNYRLSFDEQVLLYAQRPDATAVLPIDGANGWNQRFGRWVNRGATGIAVFDSEYTGRSRLKYYFNISDTHESRFARPVPLWEMRPAYEAAVMETLENSFGELAEKENLAAALLSAAKNAVEDNLSDYLTELKCCTEDSFLEELDELNVKVEFRRALENSVGYMLLKRCGMATADYFTDDDFRDVVDFNTPNTLNALGTATGDVGQMCLSAISRTVLSLQRQNRTFAPVLHSEYAIDRTKEQYEKGSEYHERTDLHGAGRLSFAKPPAAARAGDSPWEVRIAAPNILEAASQSDFHKSADIGQAEPASDGDPADSTEPRGADHITDGEGRGRNGGAESPRSHEVDGSDEQHPTRGGGNDSGGTDLQLNEESTENAGGAELPAFSDDKLITVIIENRDDDLKYKKQQIELHFSVHTELEERIEYIRSAYQDRFTEILIGDTRIGYRPQENGLLMWEGAYLSRKSESVFSWGLIAEWTGRLIDKHEYFINTHITEPKTVDSQQMSLFEPVGVHGSEEGSQPQMPFFSQPELPQQIIDEALCIGANDQNSRLIICAYFMKDHTPEENAVFLQKHYGTNGAGFYVQGREYALWYAPEGLRVSTGRTAQTKYATQLSWEQAARRIREQLDLGRYMPQSEIDRVAEYEYKTLAESLALTARDFSDTAKEVGYAPTIRLALSANGGFPETERQLSALLENPDMLRKITEEWAAFTAAHEQNRALLRFRYYRPKELLEKLQDLQREPIIFRAAEGYAPERRFFISNDEIDRILRGGERNAEYRLGVYSFFARYHDSKDREKHLKSYHGEYSGYHGGNDNRTYTGKGFSFSHGDLAAPYAKVELSWNKIAKRIAELISDGKFLSEADRATMPQYERKQLARSIHRFFYDTPEGYPKPFSQNMLSSYWEGVQEVAEQLDDPARAEEIYQTMMLPLWEATPQEDRNYEGRKAGLNDMRAYLDGTYSVFNRAHTLAPLSERAAPEPTTPELPIAEDVLDDPESNPESAETEPAEKETSAALASPKPKRERVAFTTLHPEIPAAQRQNYHITDNELGYGSASEKYAANVAAIRMLKRIESEERLATPDEQKILSRYVGWGGLADCFDERHGKYLEFKSLLSEDEYAAARASSLTAFYTSPVIIRAMYQALSQMGFRQGNILEPSCGIGNFIGMLPESMADSKVYGVELDSISGRIAQQLYQNSSIAVTGFEKVQMPDSFFDVAIGNVPFGDFKVQDKKYDKNNWLIHDYFFGKALDKVRPGGVVAFITSKGTMDKENSSVRKYLAQRADLIGAIRLPNDVFKRNAGTEVTSDIIFMQKRDRMTDIEPDWVYLDTDPNGIRINRYFVQHPEMILGEMVMESGRFGIESTCRAYEDAALSELLSEAIQNLHAQIMEYEAEELEEEDASIPADPGVRNFSYCLVDGKVYYRENARMHSVELSVTAENRIRGMIAIRECVRRLIEYQTENYPDEYIQNEQAELNRLYDDYTSKYGLLSSRGNSLAFGEDSSYCLLCSLEVLDEEGNLKRKADMFTKRTIRPP